MTIKKCFFSCVTLEISEDMCLMFCVLYCNKRSKHARFNYFVLSIFTCGKWLCVDLFHLGAKGLMIYDENEFYTKVNQNTFNTVYSKYILSCLIWVWHIQIMQAIKLLRDLHCEQRPHTLQPQS